MNRRDCQIYCLLTTPTKRIHLDMKTRTRETKRRRKKTTRRIVSNMYLLSVCVFCSRTNQYFVRVNRMDIHMYVDRQKKRIYHIRYSYARIESAT